MIKLKMKQNKMEINIKPKRKYTKKKSKQEEPKVIELSDSDNETNEKNLKSITVTKKIDEIEKNEIKYDIEESERFVKLPSIKYSDSNELEKDKIEQKIDTTEYEKIKIDQKLLENPDSLVKIETKQSIESITQKNNKTIDEVDFSLSDQKMDNATSESIDKVDLLDQKRKASLDETKNALINNFQRIK